MRERRTPVDAGICDLPAMGVEIPRLERPCNSFVEAARILIGRPDEFFRGAVFGRRMGDSQDVITLTETDDSGSEWGIKSLPITRREGVQERQDQEREFVGVEQGRSMCNHPSIVAFLSQVEKNVLEGIRDDVLKKGMRVYVVDKEEQGIIVFCRDDYPKVGRGTKIAIRYAAQNVQGIAQLIERREARLIKCNFGSPTVWDLASVQEESLSSCA